MDPGVWGIPGGRVEPNEAEEFAAISETEEELGKIPFVEFVDLDILKSGEFEFFTFLTIARGDDVADWEPTLNWENDDWGWFDGRALPGSIHPEVERVIRKWLSIP